MVSQGVEKDGAEGGEPGFGDYSFPGELLLI